MEERESIPLPTDAVWVPPGCGCNAAPCAVAVLEASLAHGMARVCCAGMKNGRGPRLI